MIIMYPVGIPLLFGYLLFKQREKLNPIDLTKATKTVPLDLPVRAFLERRRRITASREVALTGFPIVTTSSRYFYWVNDGDDEGLRATVTEGRTRAGVRRQRAFRGPLTNTERGSDRCDYTHEEVRRGQDIAKQQH